MKVTLALLLAGAAIILPGQTLDTGILGIVTDSSGAVVANASVTITQTATGVKRTTPSAADGKYEVRYLAPGEYSVEVQAAGFRTARASSIVIQINQQARLDFTLQVGDVQQVLEVSATAPLLQTENSTLGEVVARERIVNLPLNGRTFTQLAQLTPGVRISEANLFSTSTGGSRIIANGARDAWEQVNLDGITMVNNRSNYINLYPSIEAIQEFKVQSGNYSAEYGGNAGPNVNVQLRSGTNQLHGTLFEFLRNDKLDAHGYFRPEPFPKDVLRRNQFGAVVSGPIRRDFAQWLIDSTQRNYSDCATLKSESVSEAEQKAASLKEKAEVSQALKASFAYSADALKTMDDQKAISTDQISNPLLHLVMHNNEIYGNIVGYLPASGIVPPSTAARGSQKNN